MKSLFLASLLVLIAACSHNEVNRDVASVKAKEGVRTITKHFSIKVAGGLEKATSNLYDICAREAIKNNALTDSYSLDILSFKDGSRRRHPSDLEAICTYKEGAQRRCIERSSHERTVSCTRSEKRVEYTALDGCPKTVCVKRDRPAVGACPQAPVCSTNNYLTVEDNPYGNGCPIYRCVPKRRICPQENICLGRQYRNPVTCQCEPLQRDIPGACPAVECRPGQTKVPSRRGGCPVCI